jgi:hypothetical protein
MFESFYTSEFVEFVKTIVSSILSSYHFMCFGQVVDFDQATHSVKVRLLPELYIPGSAQAGFDELSSTDETGFIPLLTPWAGKGWGDQASPIPGEAYCLILTLGRPMPDAAFAIGPFYNLKNPPAGGGVPAGERKITHSTGTSIWFKNDSSIEVDHPSGTFVVINSDGSIGISTAKPGQPITILGALIDEEADEISLVSDKTGLGDKFESGKALLNEVAMATYNAHVHGDSPPPTKPMILGVDTTVKTKAT